MLRPAVASALTLVTLPAASVVASSGNMCDALAKSMVPRGSISAAKQVMSARSAPGMRIAALMARSTDIGVSRSSPTLDSASTAPWAAQPIIAEYTPWPVASPTATSTRPPDSLR